MADQNADALPGDAEFERQVEVMAAAYHQRAKRKTMTADPKGAIRCMLRAWERAAAKPEGSTP
jgi:hypothetical protein